VAYLLTTAPLTDNPVYASSSGHTHKSHYIFWKNGLCRLTQEIFALDGTLISADIGKTIYDSCALLWHLITAVLIPLSTLSDIPTFFKGRFTRGQ
jgi:hypothetical protein